MKRKIAAIFAADVAGYSRLVAEDEEETLRRLASYRAVMDDFITRAGGRIFNTAGDAVLAEFSSAVEAVRSAIDIQESLRTRNMAYPPSRQMSFRIGITVGDVVERDGDLLGDGVNIAARLEQISPVGGICISRTVHEQVANKLTVQFADIGAQQVKNIPNPVHAYKIEMRSDDQRSQAAKSASWIVPVTVAAAIAVIALGLGELGYRFARPNQAPAPSQANPPAAAVVAERATAPAPRPPEALVPETIPLIPDSARANVRNVYMDAADHKALAISTGPIGMITGQKDDQAAKAAALDICQQLADALAVRRRCELYAVGNTVVYARGHPPMPPTPWITRDPSIEKPLVSKDIPLIRDSAKEVIEKHYLPGRKSKALAIASSGDSSYFFNQSSVEEAVRRALETCGSNFGIPCMIAAIDDDFVVPVPTTMKAVALFRPASAVAIASESRDDLARRLGNGAGGWSAVAASRAGKFGLALKAASEQEAVDGAMADCAKQDRDCRIIAIGPFAVEPK